MTLRVEVPLSHSKNASRTARTKQVREDWNDTEHDNMPRHKQHTHHVLGGVEGDESLPVRRLIARRFHSGTHPNRSVCVERDRTEGVIVSYRRPRV